MRRYIRWIQVFAVIGLLAGTVACFADATWMEVDIGLGSYDYLEADATTFIHYGTDWATWNRSEAWVDVDGTGAAYAGTWQHDDGANKHLSTGDLVSGNHGNWAAGAAIDVYPKIDADGSDPWDTESAYVDEWMVFDLIKTDVSGTIYNAPKQLVLQFKIDVGTNAGRELTRLWVHNNGTIQETDDVPTSGVKLYYETGSTLNFDGTEASVSLNGDSGSTTDETWGSNSLNISIPSDGSNQLLCYVVIDSWASGATMSRTAQFGVINDGLSMDTFGATDNKIARIDATANASALTLNAVPAGSVVKFQ